MCAVVDEGGGVFEFTLFVEAGVSLGEAAAEGYFACVEWVEEDFADGGVGPGGLAGGGGVCAVEVVDDGLVGVALEEAIFDVDDDEGVDGVWGGGCVFAGAGVAVGCADGVESAFEAGAHAVVVFAAEVGDLPV